MTLRWLLLVFLGIGAHHVATFAQQPLSETIPFSCVNCKPADALVALSRQTGTNIVFSDRFFKNCPVITIQTEGESISSLLNKISACAPVAYQWNDGQVVFYKKSSRYTLNGYIQDQETGERLIGASIRALGEKSFTAISNEFGFFSLSLDEGNYQVAVAYIGYRIFETNVNLNSDRRFTFKLQPNVELPEVVVSALPSTSANAVADENRPNLPLSAMRHIPMPGGEADLMRLAALQPGVQTGVDGLGGLHIRGGNADQNLILLDDVPVYNPSHALGLFSIFNPGTLSNARLWKGDFPARYGGRTSSVFDVRTRDGNFKEYQSTVATGLFAASISAEGPLVKDKSSFLVGGRTTFLGPWVNYFSKRDNLLTFSGDEVVYRFYDTNVKYNYLFSEKDKIYFSLYHGGDKFSDQFQQSYNTSDGILLDQYSFSSSWGNTIAALRWNHLISPKLFLNSTLRYSSFLYQSQLSFNSNIYYPSGNVSTLSNYGQLYQTYISDWSGKTDFTYYPNEKLTLRWGGTYTLHNFQPGALSVNFLIPGQTPSSIDSLAKVLRNNEKLVADEAEIYIDAEWRIGKNYRLDAGLNVVGFQIRNQTYRNLQPRLRMQRTGSRGWSQWLGYHRSVQNLHQIGSFNVSLPFELWVPTTSKVPPEIAWQLSAGIGWRRGSWYCQVETYYKELETVLSFLTSNDALYTGSAGGAEDAIGWEDRIAVGQGRNRGVEFLLEKTVGGTNFTVAYALSSADRKFAEINSGRWFPFRFDRRHDVKLNVHQRINGWLTADAAWSFATGNPITLAGVKYEHLSPGSEASRDVYVYTDVNGYRLPAYHRLDLGLNATYNVGKPVHAVQLGVYNLYNRANPFFLFVDAGSGVRGKAIQYTLLPILPVFRYEIKF
ncbi:MAG: carboxypeptidase-like regulatory domain-containing protein [Saprospiraceae bacterium]|nr:carboxypeptidase-like regulatory domain-containing protein [Saprospiraceae bacterium]